MLPSLKRLRLKSSLLHIVMLVMALGGFTSLQAQNCFVNPRIKKISDSVSPTIRSYLEFKPADYNTNPTKKYALIVYIGGTGEMFQQPGGSDQDLCPVLQYSMPWRMNVGHFPDQVTDPNTGQQFSYLVVMPFVRKWEEQYQVDPGAMINHALNKYANRIHTDRIYLTGMSRGTDNLMGFITGSAANAGKIAATVPVGNCFPDYTGSGDTALFNQQVNYLATANMRLWGISCAGDRVCTENYIKNWVSALNQKKPGNALFTYATMSCDTAGPNASFHYAWNHGYDPDYRVAPGNKNVYEWMIQFRLGSTGGGGGGGTPPPNPNCSTIVMSGDSSRIKVKGLLAPVATVHVFNSSWATVFNQTYTNSPDSIIVPNLAAGTYFVKVNFYQSNWSHICEKSQNVTVTTGGGSPPPPPPPPPPSNGNCSTITVTPSTSSIAIKGVISPVAGVQVFNNSWATVFNRTYTNSPDLVTVPNLPAGLYHVKVVFYTSSWSFVCETLKDVTVGSGNTVNTETTDARITTAVAAESMTGRIDESVARSMTVSPNPFESTIWVTIGSPRNENASIVLMDMAGRPLMRKNVTLVQGYNRFAFDGVNKYRPGSYIMRLVTSTGVENVRLLRQ